MAKDYSKISNEEFDAILAEILNEMTGEQILQIPGVYGEISEHFNNEALERWEQRQADKETE